MSRLEKMLETHVTEEKAFQKEVRDHLVFLRERIAKLDARTAIIAGITSFLLTSVFAIALTLGSCAAVDIPGTQTDEIVVALVRDDGSSYCSGFVLEEGIVTAGHCVGPLSPADLRIGRSRDIDRAGHVWSRTYTSRVLLVDYDSDLALLEAPRWFPRARLRFPGARVGERVVAAGHPYGMGYTRSYGHVSRVTRPRVPGMSAPRTFFFTDATLLPGMSGGPLFDSIGRVLGVVSFTAGSPLGGIIPSDEVRELLRGL